MSFLFGLKKASASFCVETLHEKYNNILSNPSMFSYVNFLICSQNLCFISTPRLWEHQITCAQSCLQTFLMDSSPIYGLLVTLSNLYSDV
jgi:hypothetical protein